MTAARLAAPRILLAMSLAVTSLACAGLKGSHSHGTSGSSSHWGGGSSHSSGGSSSGSHAAPSSGGGSAHASGGNGNGNGSWNSSGSGSSSGSAAHAAAPSGGSWHASPIGSSGSSPSSGSGRGNGVAVAAAHASGAGSSGASGSATGGATPGEPHAHPVRVPAQQGGARPSPHPQLEVRGARGGSTLFSYPGDSCFDPDLFAELGHGDWEPDASAPPYLPGVPGAARPYLELAGALPDSASEPLPEVQAVWLSMLEGALVSAKVELPSIPAEPGPVEAALVEAAGRGVRVRVLVNDAGAASGAAAGIARLESGGVLVRRLAAARFGGGALAAQVLVVDGGDAMFGGEALREAAPGLGVHLAAPESARAVADLFEADWALAGGAAPAVLRRPANGGYNFPEEVLVAPPVSRGLEAATVTPLFTAAGALPAPELRDLPALLQLVRSTSSSLLLAVPALDPRSEPARQLAQALAQVAEAGHLVLVLGTGPSADAQEALERFSLLRGSARISVASTSSLSGALLLVVDGERAFIGSGGLTDAALLRDRNFGARIESRSVAEALASAFYAEWTRAAGAVARR